MNRPVFKGNVHDVSDILDYEEELTRWELAQERAAALEKANLDTPAGDPVNALVGIFDDGTRDFPAMLEGPEGRQGQAGPAGSKGVDGAQGVDGADGAPGPPGPPGSTDWLGLTDTDPASYAGQAGLAVRVNAGESGLEFFPAGLISSATLTGFFNTILNIFQTAGASPISIDLAPVVNLVGLNTAYFNAPEITLDAVPNPVGIRATVPGEALLIEDVSGDDVFRVEVDPDRIAMNAAIEIGDSSTGPEQYAVQYRPAFTVGAFNGGFIRQQVDVTYTNGFFIWGMMVDTSTFRAAINPGFAAWTMFNILPTIQNAGNFNLVNALTFNIGPAHARVTAGISTVGATVGMAFTPRTTAGAAGATMTRTTGVTAVQCSPVFSSVFGSTANLGTIVGLECRQPAVALFQPSGGVENMAAYYGLNFGAMPFGGNVVKAVVRSLLTPASNAYFLLNIGGAQSDFGGGSALNVGTFGHTGIALGFFGATPTIQTPAYTPTNVSFDRSFDANATTLAELADVLGTLILDLRGFGLIQ